MGHVLMVESWVGGTARLLPAALAAAGHRYTFVTRKKSHYGAEHPIIREAAQVVVAETNDVAALINALRPLHAREPFAGVLTICDYYIEQVAALAAALGVPCPFPAAVRVLRNKGMLRERLAAAGIANPPYLLSVDLTEAQAWAGEQGYPLVIKPTDLASSAFVRLVDGPAALAEAWAALADFPANFRGQERDRRVLLEGYMDGPEISVEAVTVAGQTTVVAITDKSVTGAPYFIEDGHMVPADIDAATAAQVGALVVRALASVGFDHGISHTEVKLTADGPRIVEINPRPGGNYIAELVELATGVDLLAAFFALATGAEPDLAGAGRSVGSAAISFVVPAAAGTVAAISGQAALSHPSVRRWELVAPGATLSAPIDNACYAGHIVTVDPEGLRARKLATGLREQLSIELAKERA